MFFLGYFLEYNRYLSVVGIGVIIAIAVLFSKKRSHIDLRLIVRSLFMQFVIAFAVLKTGIGSSFVRLLSNGVYAIYQFSQEGIRFVFGNLSDANGSWGFIFAINVLPVIIFFGAFTSLLFHWGVIQRCVVWVNRLVQPVLGSSGAETMCAIANSFLGQTEAPLLIRNYLKNMTRSEMLVVMVSGMATISGAILVVFAAMGVPVAHMLAASVMSIPASIMIAKILCPETKKSKTASDSIVAMERTTNNAFDAISVGTSDGLKLAVNVGAMLISFLAFLALINYCLFLGSASIN